MAQGGNLIDFPYFEDMKYVVYTFQFTPLVDVKQMDLFEPTLQIRNAIMEHKLEYFEKALTSVKYYHGKKVYESSIQVHHDNIMVMRLANRKPFVREKAFHVMQDEDEPSCGVIIDYRPEHQVIAIEDSRRAFENTDSVRNILERSLNGVLKQSRLKVSIKRQGLPSEFWDYVNQYRGRITEVRFTYQYPNLGRASEEMKKLLADTGKVVNSTESEVVFKGKSLEFDEKNEDIQSYTKDASKSGIPIKLKVKGVHKTLVTGNQTKQVDIEELDYEGDPLYFSKLKDSLDECL